MRFLDFLGSPIFYWLPTYEPSVRTRQDASNVPAVEPSLPDAKPAEAVEVPWIFGELMGKAANDSIKRNRERERERDIDF